MRIDVLRAVQGKWRAHIVEPKKYTGWITNQFTACLEAQIYGPVYGTVYGLNHESIHGLFGGLALTLSLTLI